MTRVDRLLLLAGLSIYVIVVAAINAIVIFGAPPSIVALGGGR